VTYIRWPEAHRNTPDASPGMSAADVEAQDEFYAKAVKACVNHEWRTHKQGACQFAVSVDVLRRSRDLADWVGFFDVVRLPVRAGPI
jgi:hypothetical protein